ncbi:MAG TPA: hypothetical protein VGM77_03480 [Gemmatimonadales bacterium]|jgi:hypothetical protein
MRRLTLAGCALLIAATALGAQTPTSGIAVLDLMRKHYAGKWYETLAFNQTTTIFRGDSSTKQTWHESLQYFPTRGALLRIDNGDPALGNGTLSSWDSTWSVRGGKPGRISGSGNPFIALIENVYLQPADVTVHQLEPLHFDMTQVTSGAVDGRAAWIVGVSNAADSVTPQFWIDKERLVVVRFLVQFAPTGPPLDVHLGKYVATGGGWLATQVHMYQGGKPRQFEDYYDWQTRMKLDPGLFDPATWTSAKHWFHQGG